MDGLIAKMMTTVDKSLDEVLIATPDDVVTMVKALDSLITVKASFREAMVPMAPSAIEGPDNEHGLPAIDAPRIGDFQGCVIEVGVPRR